MSDPRPWRARVLRPGGGVAGAGVLIDQRHVLTCAHVVNQALARGSHEEEPPTGEVEVDFVEAEAGRLGASVAEGGVGSHRARRAWGHGRLETVRGRAARGQAGGAA